MDAKESWREARVRRTGLTPALRQRIGLIMAVALYTAAFNLCYHRLVVPLYEFWGLGDPSVPWPYLAVSWILAVLPALWLPTSLRRPSQLLILVLYLMLFIPACFVLYYSVNPMLPPGEALVVVLTLFAGLAIVTGALVLPPIRLPRPRVPARAVWMVVGVLAVGMTAYLAVTQRGQIRLASLEQIYELRKEMAEQVQQSGSVLGFYAITWLAGFVYPLLFAWGAFRRRWWLCGAGLLGEFFLYTVGGFKMTLLAVVYLPILYVLLRWRSRTFPATLADGTSLLLLAGFLPGALGLGEMGNWLIGVIHFRVFSVPSLLIVQYYDFFRHNPLTHLSHVTGFNWLIQYPYTTDIPRTLGFHYYGDPNLGSNASFWAGDGLASSGLPGIIILSVVCALVFWLFDSCAREQDPRLAALAATVIGVTLANVSLFTTLLSGGFLFLMAAMLLLPPEEARGGGADAGDMGEGG